MHKSIIALGIESSCDDTSIGVIKVTRKDNILVSEKLGLVTLCLLYTSPSPRDDL